MGRSKQLNRNGVGRLFNAQSAFRIVEIKSPEAKKWTDDMNVLKDLITSSEPMYPNIQSWFADKVVSGIRNSTRIGYVAYERDIPIASAVLKLGSRAKFCHLKIHRDFQDLDLGQMFFTQMTLEARHYAKEIHFTLPESLWAARREFFESFGFSSPYKASRQYRPGDEELICSAPVSRVWSAAREKLPKLIMRFSVAGYSLSTDLLMSIKPMYAERILRGTKLVEIRRKFSSRWVGLRAALYSSRPMSALVGEATIKSVVYGKPEEIWLRYGPAIGCSREEFFSYVSSAKEVNAIELCDVAPYREPIPLSQVEHLLDEPLHPPQSYCAVKLEKGSAWGKAVSVAGLLHGRFTART